MDRLRFSQTIDFLPLLGLTFFRYFTRPVIMLVYGVGIVNFVLIFSSWEGVSSNRMDQLPFWIMLMVFVLLPIMIYLNTRTLFETTQLFQEPVMYEISGEQIQLTGDTFSLQYEWEAVYQVREYRRWFVIMLSRYQAVYIQREALDPTDWEILRAILRNIPDLDVRMRRRGFSRA